MTSRAGMPELRNDSRTVGVHVFDDPFPRGERFLAVKERHILVRVGGGMVDAGPLGYDQTNRFRAADIVFTHLIAGNISGRTMPGHRRHDDAVSKLELVELERLEQCVDITHFTAPESLI